MTKNNSKDLTVGSPTGLILGFSLPLLLGMLFQQVYSLMDTIIVGRFLSVSALAAVGSTGSICFLIIGFWENSVPRSLSGSMLEWTTCASVQQCLHAAGNAIKQENLFIKNINMTV